MTIEELSKKIDKYRYQNLGFIALGFALAISGFVRASVCWTDIVVYSLATIFFLVVAGKAFRQSRKFKVK